MRKIKRKIHVFDAYIDEVDASIKRILLKVKREEEKRRFVDANEYPIEMLRNSIISVVGHALNQPLENLEGIELELPPPYVNADFSFSVFKLAKILGTNPGIIANKIKSSIMERKLPFVESVENIGPFVNLVVKKENFYAAVVASVEKLGRRYGESDYNIHKVALFDYSAPNIAKPIGIGHLRSTVVGQSLANIYRATGCTEIRDNHIGDWGTQFGELIYAYKEWGNDRRINNNPLEELKNLYVKFHREADKHPYLENEARGIFKKLEEKDDKLVGLWKHFRDISISRFRAIYKRLGIEFDSYIGESYFVDKVDDVVRHCLAKGIARRDKGTEAVVVDSLEGTPSFLIRKQDGSSLYLSRDLATIRFRVSRFKPNVIIYVVGNEQELHFKQLIGLSRKTNILSPTTEAKHVGFGMILVGGKKMSTRRGTSVELEEILNQSVAKARELILHKSPSLKNKNKGINRVAEIVGLGAVVYNDLRQSRAKNISFNWLRMLNFRAGSSVYLQYACVRISSILDKAKEQSVGIFKKNSKFKFEENSESELVRKLALFPLVVIKAQQLDATHVVCEYLENLAQLFNNFYDRTSVLNTENSTLRHSRLALIKSVRTVIDNGLTILNIGTPRRM